MYRCIIEWTGDTSGLSIPVTTDFIKTTEVYGSDTDVNVMAVLHLEGLMENYEGDTTIVGWYRENGHSQCC